MHLATLLATLAVTSAASALNLPEWSKFVRPGISHVEASAPVPSGLPGNATGPPNNATGPPLGGPPGNATGPPPRGPPNNATGPPLGGPPGNGTGPSIGGPHPNGPPDGHHGGDGMMGGPMMPGGHHNSSLNTDADKCHYIEIMGHLVQLASNTTWLDVVTQDNATEIAAIQLQAADAKIKITAFTSNSTLMATCNVIFAYEDDHHNCSMMNKLQKMQKLAANATLLGLMFNQNQTLISSFQAKIAAQAPKLNALQNNSTLTAFCSVEHEKEQCMTIMGLQYEIAMAGNSTNSTHDSHMSQYNKEMIYKVKDHADSDAAVLQALVSNATLVSLCPSFVPGFSITNAALTNSQVNPTGAASRIGGVSGAITAALIAVAMVMASL